MKKNFTIIFLLFNLSFLTLKAQNGNVGIGTNNPLTKLDITGAISTESSGTPVSVTGNTTVTVGNYSYIKLSTTITDPSTAKVSLSNGLQDGQILTLYNASATNYGVELDNAANLQLTKTPLNLMGRSASYFIWDATATMWIEIGHVPTLPTKEVFTYTGADQVFTVPAGITSINVKLWGAGGGPGYIGCTNPYPGISGGSGGYVAATIKVTPLQNLIIGVGQGGYESNTGLNADGSLHGMGGGAAGGTASSSYGYVGIGGGCSYITSYDGSITYAVAGGGGGAGGAPYTSTSTIYCFGGAGGGTTGGDGGRSASSANSGGKGGTPFTGGAGGTGLTNNGSAGASFSGGIGGNSSGSTTCGGGGGGGGGYYGGGGGAGGTSSLGNSGGGGGGSSYTNPTYTSAVTNTPGTSGSGGGQKSPPLTGDVDYLPGTGTSGYVGTYIYGAGDGLVVISW